MCVITGCYEWEARKWTLRAASFFLKAAETGSITKAALALGYTQAGVSLVVRKIEEECGFHLLIREKNGVRLTDAGARLLPIMRENSAVGRALPRDGGGDQRREHRHGARRLLFEHRLSLDAARHTRLPREPSEDCDRYS